MITVSLSVSDVNLWKFCDVFSSDCVLNVVRNFSIPVISCSREPYPALHFLDLSLFPAFWSECLSAESSNSTITGFFWSSFWNSWDVDCFVTLRSKSQMFSDRHRNWAYNSGCASLLSVAYYLWPLPVALWFGSKYSYSTSVIMSPEELFLHYLKVHEVSFVYFLQMIFSRFLCFIYIFSSSIIMSFHILIWFASILPLGDSLLVLWLCYSGSSCGDDSNINKITVQKYFDSGHLEPNWTQTLE